MKVSRTLTLWLLVLLGAFTTASAQVGPTSSPAQAQADVASNRIQANLYAEPTTVEVGESVTWILSAEHPRKTKLRLVKDDPTPDYSWALISGPTETNERRPTGRILSTWTWQLMSLEAGERALPLIELRDDEGHAIVAQSSLLTVASALTADEDTSRVPAGLHDPVNQRLGRISLWWLALLPLGGLLLIAYLIARSRRSQPVAPEPPSANEILVALRARDFDQVQQVREIFYGLTALLRAELDRLNGSDLGTETDEEWLRHARADQHLKPEEREELVKLFATCEEVKYGAGTPTRFRVEECLNTAGSLCESMLSASAAQQPSGGDSGEAAA